MRSLCGETTGQILKMKCKHMLTFLIQSFLTRSKKILCLIKSGREKGTKASFSNLNTTCSIVGLAKTQWMKAVCFTGRNRCLYVWWRQSWLDPLSMKNKLKFCSCFFSAADKLICTVLTQILKHSRHITLLMCSSTVCCLERTLTCLCFSSNRWKSLLLFRFLWCNRSYTGSNSKWRGW